MTEKIKGFKGFDKDLKCRGFQFEHGKTFETDEVKICNKGFHFCENPIDVFSYYPPGASCYSEVEGEGKTEKESGDTKVSCSKIHIGAEGDLKTMVSAAIKFVFEKIEWKKGNSTTGDRSGSQATGYQSGSQATGYRSGSQATGDQSGSQATGYQSGSQATGDFCMASSNGWESKSSVSSEKKEAVAMAIGKDSKAKGTLNSFLVLAEWEEKKDGWHISSVMSVQIDGKKIKADTWYILKGGKFTEIE